MIRLISDSSALYSPSEAEALGFDVNPLVVTINGTSYEEYTQIQADYFIKKVREGNIPMSSQPTVGKFIEIMEKYPEDEIIVLCMADGLSGTYQTAVSAAQHVENPERIHVVNTKTLCGPHRHLVDITLSMIKDNLSMDEILKVLEAKIETSTSFLIPQDFSFLKRGGRCTPLASVLGGVLHLAPVVMETKDGRRLDKFITARSYDIAINKIVTYFKEHGLNDKYILYVTHADTIGQAKSARQKFITAFSNLDVEILDLSCAFITQGGPSCVAIQAIEK